jgi:hypothetical protein
MARRGAVAVAALALLASGCGADDPDGPDRAPASSDASPDTSPEASPSETSSPPEPVEETPAVEPASGPVLQVGGYSVSAPRRFKVNYDTPFVDTAIGPVGGGLSGGVTFAVYATADPLSLDQAMRRSWRPDRTKPPSFAEQPTTTMGSRTAYYYTADEGKYYVDHVMGMWDGGLVELRVEVSRRMPPVQQREIVESVRLTYARG